MAAALPLPASAGPSGQAETAAAAQRSGQLKSANGEYVVPTPTPGTVGYPWPPGAVERVMTRTAKQTPCPFPPIFTYPDRDPSYNAACEGTLARNGIYGRGIVNALTAVLD